MLKSRKVVHDMKNHILALKKYDQEQNWSGLHEYLNELSDNMLEYNFHVWTGNHMLDMILNQKEKDAQNQNTVMQIDTEVYAWNKARNGCFETVQMLHDLGLGYLPKET